MQSFLIYIPCKGEYIEMAPSAIHIIEKIEKYIINEALNGL